MQYNTFITSPKYKNYKFIKLNLEDIENFEKIFKEEKFDAVCNLAAQAGVCYSLSNCAAYIDSNIVSFMNILECCRYNLVQNLS